MDSPARYLVFHGAIVLLVGLLCGAPYGRAINRNAPTQIVNSWRVAHASLSLGATLMFALAGVLASFTVETPVKWIVCISFITSSYAFCVSLPLAAITGYRGLTSQGPASARLVYAGNMLGALASLVAALVLVYAGYASL